MFLGLLEVDTDCFEDDDDIQDNPYAINAETDWRREEFPEGFKVAVL